MSSRPRWRGVVALAIAETTSWGILYYSFGVLLGFFEQDLGASRAAVGGAFSAALLAAAIVSGPVGRAIDRWGTRRVMTLGSVLAVLSFAALSRATSLWHLYVLWILVGVSHAGVLYEPAFAAVARWFPAPAARTRALLVVTSFGGFASTVFLPLMAVLCERHGWRGAVLLGALGLGAVTIPLHASLPPDVSARAKPTGASVFPPAARLLAILSALQAFVSAGVTVHLVGYLHASGGLGLADAASVAGVMGAAQVPGRVLFAPFARWAGSRRRLPTLLALQCAGLLGIAGLRGAPLIAAVALFGASNGMLTLERATLVAERFGVRDYGAVNGRIATFSLVGRALAPVAVSSSMAAFLALAGVLAAATALAIVRAPGTSSRSCTPHESPPAGTRRTPSRSR